MAPSRVILPFAFFFLLLGVLTGIFRLMVLSGVNPPSDALTRLYSIHGELMVSGFLVILIVAERYFAALSLQGTPRIIHLMPIFIVMGVLSKFISGVMTIDPLAGILHYIGGVLFMVGVLLYMYFTVRIFRHGTLRFTMGFMLLAAALLFAVGGISTLRFTTEYAGRALLMLSFPLLTILGERIELGRVFLVRKGSRAVIVAGVLAGVGGIAAMAFTLVGTASWLLTVSAVAYSAMIAIFLRIERFSTGGIVPRPSRLNSYVHIHVKSAYAWLIVSFVFFTIYAVLRIVTMPTLFLFDAAIHALALGFVGGMILAHGPVILPSLLNRSLNEAKLSLIPLTVLAWSVALRVVGDVIQAGGVLQPAILTLSGVLIPVALISFFAMMWRITKPRGREETTRRGE